MLTWLLRDMDSYKNLSRSELVDVIADLQRELEGLRNMCALGASDRLIEAIEHIAEGFVLRDENDNVVAYNQRYIEYYPTIKDTIRPGIPFRELLDVSAQRGQYVTRESNQRKWIDERLEIARQLKYPIEQQLEDGRWLLINEEKTESGYTVGLRMDISRLKEREHDLAVSEHRFKEMLNQLPAIAVQGYDKDHRVIFWNKASEDLYGYTKNEAIGERLENLIIPGDMCAQVTQAIDNWLHKGIPIPASELTLKHKDGSKVSVYSMHVMYENHSGDKELFCVDIDVSLMNKLREKAWRAENQWALTFNSVSDPIVIVDSDFRIVKANKALKDALPAQQGSVVGKKCYEVIHMGNSSHECCPVYGEASIDTDRTANCYVERMGGFFDITSHPLKYEKKRHSGRVCVYHNVTSRVREEQAKRAYLAEQKDNLIRELNHRIKNHLQGIVGLIGSYSTGERITDGLLENIASKVKSIAAIYGMQSEGVDAALEFMPMIETILNSVNAICDGSIEIECESTAAKYFLDSRRSVALAIIVNELAINALKHAKPDRKAQARVEISAKEPKARITISNPGRLPPGFNIKTGGKLGVGLELAFSMLPREGSRMTLYEKKGRVVADLEISPPLLIKP